MKNHKVDFFDKPRIVKFDINALSEAEDLLGASVFRVMADPAALISFKTQRIMWWAGLIHEDPGLSLVKVGNMMQDAHEKGISLPKMAGVITAALTATGLFQLNNDEKGNESPPKGTDG